MGTEELIIGVAGAVSVIGFQFFNSLQLKKSIRESADVKDTKISMKLDEIFKEAQKTNGRIGKLEDWRDEAKEEIVRLKTKIGI